MNRIFVAVVLFFSLFWTSFAFAGRGCCSHHGGECGCSESGRSICCDGMLSPTCTCYSPPMEETKKEKKKEKKSKNSTKNSETPVVAPIPKASIKSDDTQEINSLRAERDNLEQQMRTCVAERDALLNTEPPQCPKDERPSKLMYNLTVIPLLIVAWLTILIAEDELDTFSRRFLYTILLFGSAIAIIQWCIWKFFL